MLKDSTTDSNDISQPLLAPIVLTQEEIMEIAGGLLAYPPPPLPPGNYPWNHPNPGIEV